MQRTTKLFLFSFFALTLLAPATALGQYSVYAYRDGIGTGSSSLNSVQQTEHANLARCLCDEAAGEGEYYSFYLEMAYSGTYDGSDAYYYVGSDCSNTAVGLDKCAELATINVNSYQDSHEFVPLPINYMVDPAEGVCSMVSSGSNTFYIFSALEGRTVAYSESFSFDTQPPSAPYNVTVSPGEGALTVKWENTDVDEEGVNYFNVLCMREGSPGEAASEDKADWIDTEEVCGKVLSIDGTNNTNNTNSTNNTTTTNNTNTTNNTSNTNDTNTTNKAGFFVPPAPSYDNQVNVAGTQPPTVTGTYNTKELSCPDNAVVGGGRPYKCYVCATAPRTSSSVRINGLENGITYTVAVVAVDDHRNVSEMSTTQTGVPAPMTDFAEQYSGDGGSATGDYCFIATAVFGGKDHAAVQILRLFRDDILLKNELGRRFVRWYYTNGERMASFIEGHPVLAFLVKLALLPLVFLAVLLIVTPWWGFFLFGLFIWSLYNRSRLVALLSSQRVKHAE